jgi:hypothetical protein
LPCNLTYYPNGRWYLWVFVLSDVFSRWLPYGELQIHISNWR